MSVTLSDADYLRLLEAAELDDMIAWCETCGAWIDRNDPRLASVEGFDGCWFAATFRERDRGMCLRESRPGKKQFH